MRRKVYGPRKRFLLIRYKDDKIAVMHTLKPYNDINDFPKHVCEPMECKDISFFEYVRWTLRNLISKPLS